MLLSLPCSVCALVKAIFLYRAQNTFSIRTLKTFIFIFGWMELPLFDSDHPQSVHDRMKSEISEDSIFPQLIF